MSDRSGCNAERFESIFLIAIPRSLPSLELVRSFAARGGAYHIVLTYQPLVVAGGAEQTFNESPTSPPDWIHVVL